MDVAELLRTPLLRASVNRALGEAIMLASARRRNRGRVGPQVAGDILPGSRAVCGGGSDLHGLVYSRLVGAAVDTP